MIGGGNGRGFLGLGHRPVEIREERREGVALAWWVAMLQALSLAGSTALLVLSVAIAPVLMGERVVWVCGGIAALSAFIHSLWSKKVRATASAWHLLDVLAGVVLVVLVTACWWLFVLNLGIEIPQSYRPWTALLGLLLLTFSATLCGCLLLAFGQELAYRSPFFEQGFFTDVLPYWAKRIRPVAPDMHIQGKVQRIETDEPPDEPVLSRDTRTFSELHLFLLLVDECGGLLTREKLTGLELANGRKLTKPSWQRCIGKLCEWGCVERVGTSYQWIPSHSAGSVLAGYIQEENNGG